MNFVLSEYCTLQARKSDERGVRLKSMASSVANSEKKKRLPTEIRLVESWTFLMVTFNLLNSFFSLFN
jgi:hypothetical protein